LENGNYPGSFVLNWVQKDNPLVRYNGNISFQVRETCAQIIDGQHRIAGIRAAIEEDDVVEGMMLPVVFYENLNTRECADIFLSINTEQKPVPRSLVFDLYGIASEPVVDPASVRARDIAIFLNMCADSPYYDNIKFPGDAKRKGGIALSTAVTAIKPLVEEKGHFEQIGITELETQQTIILNFFTALRLKYGAKWNLKSNAFQYASGFVGEIDFFKQKMMNHCYSRHSFKVDTIGGAMNITGENLILQDDVKGLGGKDAPRVIYQRLLDSFRVESDKTVTFEV